MHQASQSTSEVTAEEPAVDVSMSVDGKSGVAALRGGRVELLAIGVDGTASAVPGKSINLGKPAGAIAIDAAAQSFATGEADGIVRLWSVETGRELVTLNGHTAAVTSVSFLPSGRLLSASQDKTIRLWEAGTGKQLAIAWHIAPLQELAVSGGASPIVVAAALADARSGRAVVWQLNERASPPEFQPRGDFTEHGARCSRWRSPEMVARSHPATAKDTSTCGAATRFNRSTMVPRLIVPSAA
ncbi:MAG: hypothetical protein R3B90_12360 [Planctomycetaceae bacterium]